MAAKTDLKLMSTSSRVHGGADLEISPYLAYSQDRPLHMLLLSTARPNELIEWA